MTAELNPYLCFKGDCEAAFQFYERVLGGRIEAIFRYRGTPLASRVPPDWQDKVMHGTFLLGDRVLMAADVAAADYKAPAGFSLSLNLVDIAESERIFHDLSEGGRVTVPLEKTFWAARFGMIEDRFGIAWMVNCNGE